MPDNDALISREEVALFCGVLSHAAASSFDEAIKSIHKGSKVVASDFHGPIGEAYWKAASHIGAKQLDRLERSELQEILKKEIFPQGRASEDFRDNVLDLFDFSVKDLVKNGWRNMLAAHAKSAPQRPVDASEARHATPEVT